MKKDRAAVPSFSRGESFGRCLRRVDIGGSVVRDTLLPANLSFPLHVHQNPYVCVLLGGHVAEQSAQALCLAPGSVVVHPAGHAHANRTGSGGARCINIELDETLLRDDALRQVFQRYRPARLLPTHPALRALQRALGRDDSAAGLTTLGAALGVLATVLECPPTQQRAPWFDRLIDYLEADVEHTPTADELARVASVHPSHLMRVFKRHTGESIGGYLRRRRLEAADDKVRRGDLPLAAIAVEAGFCDQAHFTRAYRSQFGTTPGRQRRRGGY